VRHEQTKEAIEGVTVHVYGTSFLGPLVTKTDSKGAYRFTSLAPGVYVIQVRSDDEKSILAKRVDLDGALTYRADFWTAPPPTRDPAPPWRVRLENRRADPLRRFLSASGRPACP
jgi:protocatechuate 3,4-dioxygenase beta subunit